VYHFKNNIRRKPPVIFLVSLLIILTSCDRVKHQFGLGKYSIKTAIEWAKQDSARVADTLKRIMPDKKVPVRTMSDSVKKVLSQKKAFQRTLTDSLMTLEDMNTSEQGTSPVYYIIAGSYSSHENAIERAKLYSTQGYKAIVINSTGRDGTKRELVSVRAFKNRDEASVFLRKFKAEYDPGAWIYSRE
jgi:hypothetical protein